MQSTNTTNFYGEDTSLVGGAANAPARSEFVRHWQTLSFEKKAKLLRENPVTCFVLSGGGMYLFLKQFFKLWPELEDDVQPYITGSALVTGGIGFVVGLMSMSYINSRKIFGYLRLNQEIAAARFENYRRTWVASVEGLGAIFPFMLGEGIVISCANDDNWIQENGKYYCKISELQFFGELMPAPAVVALLYTLWNATPASCHKKLGKIVNGMMEIFFRILLFSRYIQAVTQTCFILSGKWASNFVDITHPALYEVGALGGAVVAVGVQMIKDQHKEKVHTSMMFVFAAVIIIQLGHDIKKEYNAEAPYGSLAWISALSKTIAALAAVVAGSYLTGKWTGIFAKEQRMIDRLTRAESTNIPRLSPTRPAISPTVMQALIEECGKDQLALNPPSAPGILTAYGNHQPQPSSNTEDSNTFNYPRLESNSPALTA